MKVLYIIDSLKGYGAEKSLVEISISMRGIIPVFVHICEGEDLKPLLRKHKIQVYSLNMPSKTGARIIVEEITSIVLKEKPDIIHTTLFKADMVGRKLKERFPEILLVGSFVNNSYSNRRYRLLSLVGKLKLFSTQLRDRATAGKVDHFISNSSAIKKENVKALGVSEKKVTVIHRGRKFEVSPEKTEKPGNKEENGHRSQVNVFVNIARLQKRKGPLDLLRAFKLLKSSHPSSILLLAGEGKMESELKEEIAKLKLENSVELLGYSKNVKQLLADCTYFVFPSYYEGLPGAVIEAIIAKKPCIVTNIPEVRECFPPDGALFFKPGDVEGLSQRMSEAIVMDNWDQKILRSFDHAYEKFKIEDISRKYAVFYEELLKQKT